MAGQIVIIKFGGHTEARISREQHQIIIKEAIKSTRKFLPKKGISWFDIVERQRAAVDRDMYGYLHDTGQWRQTE